MTIFSLPTWRHQFGYPVLIVVDNRLGAINQGLQATITANCFREGLEVAGLVLNDSQAFPGDQSLDSNFEQIAKRSIAPVLTRREARFAENCETEVDWMAIAKMKKVARSLNRVRSFRSDCLT